jgi:hypothetical protein
VIYVEFPDEIPVSWCASDARAIRMMENRYHAPPVAHHGHSFWALANAENCSASSYLFFWVVLLFDFT